MQNTVLYGDAIFVPPMPEPLRAGSLTLIYENGDLRRIKRGDAELINRIYGAVRGDDWGTPPGIRTEFEKIVGEDSFRIVYDSRHVDETKGIDFVWRGTLTGEPDGTITFDFDGEAQTTFRRNRIGICVLHPASLAGVTCAVTHPDGNEESGVLPDTISPDQPFLDIAGFSFVGEGFSVSLTFSGDVFEMEDQRNWLDASYKTYSTPLSLPYPVEVSAGERIKQTVVLKCQADQGYAQPEDKPTLEITVTGEKAARFPGFGLSLPKDNVVSSAVKQSIGAVRFDHFRLEINAAEANWQATLAEGLRQAKRLDAPLMVAVRNAEAMTGPIPDAASVTDWLLIAPRPEAIAAARAALPAGTRLIGGFDTNFTELNRHRDIAAGLEGVYYGGNPQVHAFDNTSIMEVPPILAEAQRAVRSFAGDKPIFIGPLTFYGAYFPQDARQKALFGAAWYLAALSYAAQGGAERITLCELAGERGVVAPDGTPYPVYEMLAPVGTATGGVTHFTRLSDVTALAALAIHSEDEAWQDLFVANLTPTEKKVRIHGLLGASARVRILDASSAPSYSNVTPQEAPGNRLELTLSAYAVAQIITGTAIT